MPKNVSSYHMHVKVGGGRSQVGPQEPGGQGERTSQQSYPFTIEPTSNAAFTCSSAPLPLERFFAISARLIAMQTTKKCLNISAPH